MQEGTHGNTVGMTMFVVVNYICSIVLNISLSNINQTTVIILTTLSIAALVYKMVSTRIRDQRSGIDVFKFWKKPKKVTKNTSLSQLIEILHDAEESGNHEYAKVAIEHYIKLNTECD